jgi:nucleotide-binding universal stress UspA family protein
MERTRIVVGIDGSAPAHEALRWAVLFGETLPAEVVAVHAVGMLENVHDRGEAADAWRAKLRDLVERAWCADLARARCARRVVVRDGPPVDVLLATAGDEHADLLVVGSRGVGATDAALSLGSTSLQILQATRLPVLVVPDRREGTPPPGGLELQHILVGIDRSEPSLAALELAADIAQTIGGSLNVAEVVEYVPPFPLGPSTAVTSEGEEQALEPTMALLEAQVRGIRERGVGVQVVVRSGNPAAALWEVADDVDADLVVLGTRGRGGPGDLLLGSVARTVAHRMRRPTLVVPAAAGWVSAPTSAAGQRIRSNRDDQDQRGHTLSEGSPWDASLCE